MSFGADFVTGLLHRIAATIEERAVKAVLATSERPIRSARNITKIRVTRDTIKVRFVCHHRTPSGRHEHARDVMGLIVGSEAP